jgi:L-lactate dehydrogenase complex protein LldG
MNEARETVLTGIRTALGRGSLSQPARVELEMRFTDPPVHPKPRIGDDLRQRFVTQLQAVAATTERVPELGRVPAAVLGYLRDHDLGNALVAAPALRSLPWPGQLEIRFGAARGLDRVSVTPCFAAVAETGTLVLLSGPESPTTLNFLPDDHIVLVDMDQLVGYPEQVWPKLRALPEGLPRTVNLISGPSKTADVEQTLQIGAHGPRRLHVILVGD